MNKETIKSVKEKFQKILKENKFNDKIAVDSDEHQYILEKLTQNHPDALEKIGCGVEYFYIQKSKFKYNQYNYMIKRIDGSTMDFSFYSCTKSKYKNDGWNPRFREIVLDQINSFRQEAFKVIGVKDKFVCAHTKLKWKKIYAHVDHVYPITFQSILIDYLKTYNIDLKSIKLSKDNGDSTWEKILDEEIIKTFSEFHKERAILRVVISTANLQAKNTKDYNGLDPFVIREDLIKQYPQYHL